MSIGRAFQTSSIGHRLAYGYAVAGIVLLTALALRATDLEAWFWQ